MKINRENNTIIKKRKINLQRLEKYDQNKINLATQYLKREISTSYVSHFNNVSYLLGKTTVFSTKNSGCINECQKLKKELKKLGLKTYFVSCQANGFSNPAGDFFVKEAHVFLIYPSLRNNKVYFIIFDPGFRLDNPISFYDSCNSNAIKYLSEGTAKVIFNNKSDYPYELVVNKRINYKHQVSPANIHWKFNPYYETLNIEHFNEQLYHAMFSLKLMNYPDDLDKYICINARIIDNTIEVYTALKNEIFSFKELFSLSKSELKHIFEPYFKNASLTDEQLNEFLTNLFLLIHNTQDYISTIISSEVVNDYKLGKRLNR